MSLESVEKLTQILGSSCYLQSIHGGGRPVVAVPKQMYVIFFILSVFIAVGCMHVESRKLSGCSIQLMLFNYYAYFFRFRLTLLWYVIAKEVLLADRCDQTESVISTTVRRVSRPLRKIHQISNDHGEEESEKSRTVTKE